MPLSLKRKIQNHPWTGRTLANFVRLVYRTSTIIEDPVDGPEYLARHHPCIIAFWHGQFMMFGPKKPPVPTAAMVAKHGDAKFIGAVMEEFGFELVHGAGASGRKKDRGGAAALRIAVDCLKSGKSFSMTADVPPGPARRAGEGLITLARISGRPIIAIAAATSRYTSLNTWSRMTINLPHSKLAYVASEPMYVPRDADAETLEQIRLDVEAMLNRTQLRAYELAGADPARATPVAKMARGEGRIATGTGLALYRRGTAMLQPFAPALLRYRARQGKEDASRRGERLGTPSQLRPEGALAWVHAASVGETNAVLPLIDSLARERPELSFLLTTGTVTSADIAGQRLPGRTVHQFVPLDTPRAARNFIAHWRPDIAMFTESEIWPNLILETAGRNIPLVLVNGRMSDRSYKRWKGNPGISGPLFSRFHLVIAQNDKLARRFGELGAPQVLAAGNIKIDAPPQPVDAQAFERLRSAIGTRPVFVAASTHDGEDVIVADAHRSLQQQIDRVLTIIAPRHPERGTAIAEMLKAKGLKVALRSMGAMPDATTDVYIADTIGELGLFYALAPVVLLGGSLIDRGGQNPIEAIRHGAAVLTGPAIQNFKDIYDTLVRHKGVTVVTSAGDLASAVAAHLTDEGLATASRAAAVGAIATLGGALERTVAAILPLLPGADAAAENTTNQDQGMMRAS